MKDLEIAVVITKPLYDEVVATLETLAKLGNGESRGNSIGNTIAARMLDKLLEREKSA